MFKFADDTYIIIPAVNASSRQTELSNGEAWGRANNLKVNPATGKLYVFGSKVGDVHSWDWYAVDWRS